MIFKIVLFDDFHLVLPQDLFIFCSVISCPAVGFVTNTVIGSHSRIWAATSLQSKCCGKGSTVPASGSRDPSSNPMIDFKLDICQDK